ncbi:MAG: transcriptional repressor LexA [Rhodospirillales bacterium]|nr:transcriptional repressor LexA [Rhodospirillales bacterium]
MLTKKQRDLLVFIHERMQSGEVAPSFDEMRAALGLKSKSGIHRLINGLVERSYLERLPHRARALSVRRLPEGYRVRGEGGKSSLTVVPDPVLSHESVVADAVLSVPLYGRIAAGTPIEAIRDEGASVDVPQGFLGAGTHYALTVQGDSMIGAGINDHDTVIIRRCEDAESGAIVVALVDGQEATLKRLRRDRGKIILESENEAYPPRILEPKRVRIQGRLVSLLRRYDGAFP